MLHILITVKPSERCPGKNKALAELTYKWLKEEIKNIKEPFKIYTVGYKSEVAECLSSCTHVECATGSHCSDIKFAESIIKANPDTDIFILLQLTNPVRRKNLLKDAVEKVRNTGKSTVSCCITYENKWRVLDEKGRWSKIKPSNTSRMIDGALYAWLPSNADTIFDAAAEHSIVDNIHGSYIDVDFNDDMLFLKLK